MDRYKYVVNVEMAVARGDTFLVTVRSDEETYMPGALAMPGGKVDPATVTANVLEETAYRELLEETGLIIRRIEYLESKSFRMSEDTFVVDVVFLAEVEPGEARVLDPKEIKDLMWLTADEILDNPLTPKWLAESIERADRVLRGRRLSGPTEEEGK